MSKNASASYARLLSVPLLVCVLMSAACSTSTKQSVAYSPPQPPSDLAAPCQNLRPISDGKSVTVAVWIIDTVQQYNDCQAKHEGLLRAWPSITFSESLGK